MTDSTDSGPDTGEPRAAVTAAEPTTLNDGVSPAGPVAASAPRDGITVETEPDDLVVLDDLDRVQLFGLDLVDAESLDPVVEQILHGPRRDDDVLPLVLTPNVDIIVHLHNNPDRIEAELFRRAQFCLPDGQPLVVVSHLCGRPLGARLPGSGLFARMWPRIVESSIPTVVVAASDEIVRRLKEQAPHAGFVVPPMFDADDGEAIAEIAADIIEVSRSCQPELVLFGLASPKDARVMAAVLDRWGSDQGQRPLMMGVGAAFAMQVGLAKRAPEWVQRIGMEWFYRFLQEPRRLFRRYFVRDLGFIPIAWREWRSTRR